MAMDSVVRLVELMLGKEFMRQFATLFQSPMDDPHMGDRPLVLRAARRPP